MPCLPRITRDGTEIQSALRPRRLTVDSRSDCLCDLQCSRVPCHPRARRETRAAGASGRDPSIQSTSRVIPIHEVEHPTRWLERNRSRCIAPSLGEQQRSQCEFLREHRSRCAACATRSSTRRRRIGVSVEFGRASRDAGTRVPGPHLATRPAIIGISRGHDAARLGGPAIPLSVHRPGTFRLSRSRPVAGHGRASRRLDASWTASDPRALLARAVRVVAPGVLAVDLQRVRQGAHGLLRDFGRDCGIPPHGRPDRRRGSVARRGGRSDALAGPARVPRCQPRSSAARRGWTPC